MDEEEAIARLKKGDISGLELLVRKYQVRAARAAYLITRDRLLAEDIVQKAFLRSYERIGQFDATRSFGPWFLRSVVNDAVKVTGRRERRVSLEQESPGDEPGLAELLIDPQPGPEELFERSEARRAVHEALGKLTPAQRSAIVLRYYLGLNEAEAADMLKCPRGTVKRRLHDARERLRVLLSASP